jgi:ribosome-associated protein
MATLWRAWMLIYLSGMIEITPSISLEEGEIQYDFMRASGPGGQNVNKVSSAVQLRFNVKASPSLPEGVRRRLVNLAGKRITLEGILIIEAKRFRAQEQNRQDALDRLVALVRRAAARPKPRRPTRPTLASKQRRLESKRRHSEIKRLRRELG